MTRAHVDEDAGELIQANRAGLTIRELAERYGTSDKPITRVLRAAGVEMRSGGKRRARVDVDTIVSGYRAGDSILALARRHHHSRTVIRRTLEEAGVEIDSSRARRGPSSGAHAR